MSPEEDQPPAVNNPKSKTSKAPTRQPAETFELHLTHQQRESMRFVPTLRPKLWRALSTVTKGAAVLQVTKNDLKHLKEELRRAVRFLEGTEKKHLVSVQRKVAELLGEEYRAPVETESVKGDLIYQFKITLLYTQPEIWRRIQIADCTLYDLHNYLQIAFDWDGEHLYQFTIDRDTYGDIEMIPDDDLLDDTAYYLNAFIDPTSRKKPKWLYEYDFGDGWEHEILFEKTLPRDDKTKYPLCLEGERAAPPEDCGGPWGYAEILEALTKPKKELNEYMREWHGTLKPDAFDAAKVTKAMRKVTLVDED